MGPMIETDILQYKRPYIERIEIEIMFGQRLWGIDSWSLMEGLKHRPQYIQAFPTWDGFLPPTSQ